MTRIAIIFDNFGPYHRARLTALAAVSDLFAIELRTRSHEYAWDAAEAVSFRSQTLLAVEQDEALLVTRLHRALSDARPHAVFIPGWASIGALTALAWCGDHKVPAIIMSDSQKSDFPRRPVGEWVKKRLLDHVAGALVGGKPHVEYAITLGIDPARILPGYDVVDNAYFRRETTAAREAATELKKQLSLPRPFLLASARFIEKKNLPLLIDAFGASGCVDRGVDLVLLGDGPLRGQIEARIAALGLKGTVHLPGFIQYPELPKYYGLASAFVHASTTEQWGLVVNEAMASGLPVIVSEACGCVPDLVETGVNGFVFAPRDADALSRCLDEITTMTAEQRRAMGEAGQRIITRCSPETFAANAIHLVALVLGDRPRPFGVLRRVLNTIVVAARARS